jgi:hypothetical protein
MNEDAIPVEDMVNAVSLAAEQGALSRRKKGRE